MFFNLSNHTISYVVKSFCILWLTLTTGCHFRAMEMVILKAMPETTIRGMFLVRREPEAIDFSDFDFDPSLLQNPPRLVILSR